jgi:hypothetical protein
MRPTTRNDVEDGMLTLAKWYDIQSGKGTDKGFLDCAFCARWSPKKKFCQECPINVLGGQRCRNTPYQDWIKHQYNDHQWEIITRNHGACCEPFISAEIEFLEYVFRQILLYRQFES